MYTATDMATSASKGYQDGVKYALSMILDPKLQRVVDTTIKLDALDAFYVREGTHFITVNFKTWLAYNNKYEPLFTLETLDDKLTICPEGGKTFNVDAVGATKNGFVDKEARNRNLDMLAVGWTLAVKAINESY